MCEGDNPSQDRFKVLDVEQTRRRGPDFKPTSSLKITSHSESILVSNSLKNQLSDYMTPIGYRSLGAGYASMHPENLPHRLAGIRLAGGSGLGTSKKRDLLIVRMPQKLAGRVQYPHWMTPKRVGRHSAATRLQRLRW